MYKHLSLPCNATMRMSRATRESRFVQRKEFLSLLLGRRKLVRSDSMDGSIRGLQDIQTGKRYLIEDEALWR
jgi:hypothetical protein